MSSTTTPPPPPSSDSGPRVTREQMRDFSTLRRSKEPRVVAGVAEGLGRHLDVDPLIIRVVVAALTLFGGAGVALYLIAWATIPEEGSYDSGMSRLLRRDPERILVAGVTVAAVVAVVTMIGAIGLSAPNPVPITIVSVIAIAVFAIFSRRPDPGRHPDASGPAVPAGPEHADTDDAWRPTASTDGSADGPDGPDGPDTTDTVVVPGQPGSTLAGTTATVVLPVGATSQSSAPPPGRTSTPPPTAERPPRPPRPPRSHLLSMTMAVSAIAVAIVWILQETVVDDMPWSVYPGTVLAIVAAALILGAWYGRSRTLIVVGLLASLATAVASVAGPGPYGERIARPQTAAEVSDHYEHGVGRMVVHLENVSDIDQLDGRTIEVDANIGQVEVIVPSSLDATLTAHVDHGEIDGPAGIQKFSGGEEQVTTMARDDADPDVTIDVDLRFGQIVIRQVVCPTSAGVTTPQGITTSYEIGANRAAAACN